MPTDIPPFLIVAGPTAVGKSEIAVEVAERCGGEIVSADAFQVYQGLEILTAKPAADLRARVPHHLIGEIPLTESFDVAQFLNLARERIVRIHERGRIPIVAGGTGLYLRALTHGLADLPPADTELRADLEQQSTEILVQRLSELDPVGHGQIDLKNRRRLLRALEVCILTGRPFSSFREQWQSPTARFRGIVLSREREESRRRIDLRTEKMFTDGVVDEVRQIGPCGPTAGQTLGLKEIRELISGHLSEPDCIAQIQQSTRRYAKRQLTWFRREAQLDWLDISEGQSISSAVDTIVELAKAVTSLGA